MIRRFYTTPTTPEEQREADFHRRIVPLLSKKDQGRVMGEYRAVMAAEYPELVSPSPKQLELPLDSCGVQP